MVPSRGLPYSYEHEKDDPRRDLEKRDRALKLCNTNGGFDLISVGLTAITPFSPDPPVLAVHPWSDLRMTYDQAR